MIGRSCYGRLNILMAPGN